ncbi:phospholipid phosphatase-related protein type 5-like [Saccostrea echinata]|uniref:phospholipid phosphatase-related protein type 5-like n=1 Tax=Saccostrea echinata TaxID=191078 RepID=UPI002A83718E|nr:phospholipid phosphatase-related protein type 5-like [Saccostrea echinata]
MSGTDRRSAEENVSNKQKEPHSLVCVTTLLELIVLAFVISVELLLRFTTIFPLRRQPFSCVDETISRQTKRSQFIGFAFNSDLPDSIVYSLSFCLPLFIILVGEVGLWAFAEDRQRTIRVLCQNCRVPQVTRRLVRFVGVFIFGAFTLMVFVDVTKLMTGRLRPNFLEICKINQTACKLNENHGDESMCLEKDEMALKHARSSFPSMDAALSSYAAMFISTYVHGALRSRSVRVLRPFLTVMFCMLSLLCGLVKLGIGSSHWTDVAAGFASGSFMAVYLGRYVLRGFNEHIEEKKVMSQLDIILQEQRFLEQLIRELGTPSSLPLQGYQIPRAHTDDRWRPLNNNA